MKKLAGLLAVSIFALVMVAFAGCGSSDDNYYLYEVTKYKNDGIMEYDIVYHGTKSSYEGEILTGFVEECHYSKTKWTKDQVKESIAYVFPDYDKLSFVKSSLTDEGDYYCSIVEFKDLDVLDNLTALYQHHTLFADSNTFGIGETRPSLEADTLVGTRAFTESLGGTQIKEDDIESLGLHYFASKKS